MIIAITPADTVCALGEPFLVKDLEPAWQEEALCKYHLLATAQDKTEGVGRTRA